MRGIKATSYSGNTSELHSNESLADAEFTFKDNERITKFSIARTSADSIYVSGMRFDTDAGNSFEVLGSIFSLPDSTGPTWVDIPVGSGILARLRGTNCDSMEIFGSFGVDFLDELNSISITNIDYEGFANSIMPAGRGTQMSVGSQILDNRNSSVSQTITLQTTDAVTESRTVNTQIRALVGGSVAVEGKVGVPLISEGSVRTEANWQLETLNVSLGPVKQMSFDILQFSPEISIKRKFANILTHRTMPRWLARPPPAPQPLLSPARPASSAQRTPSSCNIRWTST